MDRSEEAFRELLDEQMWRLMNDTVQAENHRLAKLYYEREEEENGDKNRKKLQGV